MKLKSADVLRALMEQNRFSLARLARYSGCSKSFISHLLSGRRTSCTPELAENIAEALNLPLSVIFEPRVTPSSSAIDKQNGTAA